MLPIVEIPETLRTGLEAYRSLFCRKAGFEHIGRYLTGLITSENKTLQGIHDQQVWPGDNPISSRAMHEAVFESGWQSDNLMPHHRMLVGQKYRGKGRAVIVLDWTFSHHDRGPHIFGVKEGYDYVNKCPGRFQTVLTATVANTQRLDGIEVKIQHPLALAKEKAYLKQTSGKNYDTLADAHARMLELVHYALHCKRYQKITEIAVDVVKQIEQEHHFPDANYAFDNGLLCLG